MPTCKDSSAGVLWDNTYPFRSWSIFVHKLVTPLLLVVLVSTNLAYSQLQGGSDQRLKKWVKTTVQTSFEDKAMELSAFKKLAAARKLQQDDRQVDESVTTILTEEIKGRLTEEILTRLRAGDQESIFEFENDAYTCGPSELGGSIFDPSSYMCSATCELTYGDPRTAIGVFHNEIVNDVLPTLHAVRSLRVAMNGRDNIGELPEDPIGGIAFVFNLLHKAENPICLLAENEMLAVVAGLFDGMEDLAKILKKVPVAQIKTIAKVLHTPLTRINRALEEIIEDIEDLCEKTTNIHIIVLALVQDVTGTLTTLDTYTSLMLPPMVEATCVSDNTFTLAGELVAAIVERGENPTNPGSRERRYLRNDNVGSRSVALPKTGNLTLHDRRHFAAGLTPHPRDLPIRRALLYSDWEQRSEIEADATGNFDADMLGGHRKMALREPLNQFTTGIVSASVTAMNVFLAVFEILDETFRTFGMIWVDVALAAETFYDALETLFDGLEPFLAFFDVLFKIGDIFQSLTCPSFLGFVCFIQDLIAAAIDVIFSPLEPIFTPLIDPLVDLISLPDIDFSFPELLPDPLPWEEPIERIQSLATTLVQDVISPFIDDPLPALYEKNAGDTTGLDVLYSGARIDTWATIEDCTNTYGTKKRLPMLFHGIQRSAWCPRGYDFTAASLFPCGGLGDVDPVTGDDCLVSSDGKVPLVCVNDNYPPEFFSDEGTLNFPDFLPPRSDYILQAHYACARESTVFELGLLPAEVLAPQGVGVLSCSLGRYAVDFAEIGTPCSDQRFLDDPTGSTGYTNTDACSDIDQNRASPNSNGYISELSSYLELWNAQVTAHAACNGDHMCLVDVWMNEETITGLLEDVVPPELEGSVDSMVTQHLDLYDWGTSNPIHSNLESTFIQPDGVRESIISGVSFVTAFVDPRVAGTFDTSATDARVLTQIQCGKGSYLEKFIWRHHRESRFRGRGSEDIATMSFSCYGDREGTGTTFINFPTGTGGHGLRRTITMDCRGERGGFQEFTITNRRTSGDNDDWSWGWTCMDGTTGSAGPNQNFAAFRSTATCGTTTPIQSLEHYWHRDVVSRRFALFATEQDFRDSILIRVSCDSDNSPLERSRHLNLTVFTEDTNVGRYVARRDAKIAEYEPDVPVCESIAIENAANCNALSLDEASTTCNLPTECDSAGVRYYCPVPGLDTDLPEPEKVANAFGDNNLKDAVVECPDGMIYLPLEVTQGVPPFGGVNGLNDFVAAGCNGTTSTCAYTSPNGESARIVYQCICGEGFRPLANEEGGCNFCPLGTHRPFVVPDDGSGAALADSCLSCPAGTYGGPESDTSPVPTCHLCPKNTYSDKVGGVGEGICTQCLAGYFTEADHGSTSVDDCVKCGVNFQCPLRGERTACPVGSWTNGDTVSTSCVSCPPGTFYPTDVAVNATCTPCPPGTFSNVYGLTECTPCPVGTFGRDSGADTCEVCPQGTYQDQEGATMCQECDATRPYTGSVQTSDAAGCWDEDFRSSVDMVIRGTVVVQVSEDPGTIFTAGGAVRSPRLQSVEDPQVVINVLEASLLAWANSWATNVVNGQKVIIDPSNSFATVGDVDGHYVLSFEADADGVLSTEVEKLTQMISYPAVLIDMVTSVAQSVRDDQKTNLTMSPVPMEQSLNATVVASNDQILPPELVDFESPELVDLTCHDFLARFTANVTDAISEVGDGFCNGGVWNSPQCNYDGGDCCSSTCTPVALAELVSIRATTTDDCLTDEIGDGYCDFDNNNEICGFDGGDCCSGTCVPGSGGDCLNGTFDCRDGSEASEDIEPRAQSCAPRTMQCLDPAAVEDASADCAEIRRARALHLRSLGSESPSERRVVRRLQELPNEDECGSPVIQWGDGVCDTRLNTEACGYDGGDCCAQTCIQSPLYPTSCMYYDCVDPSIDDDEPISTFDAEAPVLKNVPTQDQNMTVYQCVPPATYQVIAVDNDPCFEGGVVVPVDEIPAGADNCSFTLTRTWTAEDLNSNFVQEQRTYHVVDTEPPVLTGLPADDIVVQTDYPNFTFGDEASVVAIDACNDVGVLVMYSEERILGGDECIHRVARTWTAEDVCGNSVSETRVATIEISSINCIIGPPPAPFTFITVSPTTGVTAIPSAAPTVAE